MALRFINESRSEQKTVYFDWWGSLSLGGMLSALVLILDQGTIKIFIVSQPEKGKANDEIISFLAKTLSCAKKPARYPNYSGPASFWRRCAIPDS